MPTSKVRPRLLLKPGDEVLIPAARPFYADPVDPNCEIVGRAIELIAPTHSNLQPCRIEIAKWIRSLRAVYGSFPPGIWQTRSAEKQELKAVAGALRKVRRMLGRLSAGPSLALFGEEQQPAKNNILAVFDLMIGQIVKQQQDIADFEAASPKKKKGAPPLDVTKFNVVEGAYDLLKQFGTCEPKKTLGGPFYELATILYEGATGKENVSLERDCRRRFTPREYLSE